MGEGLRHRAIRPHFRHLDTRHQRLRLRLRTSTDSRSRSKHRHKANRNMSTILPRGSSTLTVPTHTRRLIRRLRRKYRPKCRRTRLRHLHARHHSSLRPSMLPTLYQHVRPLPRFLLLIRIQNVGRRIHMPRHIHQTRPIPTNSHLPIHLIHQPRHQPLLLHPIHHTAPPPHTLPLVRRPQPLVLPHLRRTVVQLPAAPLHIHHITRMQPPHLRTHPRLRPPLLRQLNQLTRIHMAIHTLQPIT